MNRCMTIQMLCLAFLLGGCTAGEKHTPKILQVPINAIPDLDLKFGNNINAAKVVDNVFERLVGIDESLSPVPELATSWQMDDQDGSIIFALDSNRKFHDGSTVTSQDVLNSFIVATKNGNQITSQIDSFENCIEQKLCRGFRIVDSHHFILRLKNKNYSLLMKNLATSEASIVKKTGGKYIGSGPYKISQITDSSIVADKFDDRALFEKIIYKKINPKDSLELFKNKEIDVVSDIDFPESNETNFLSKLSYNQKIAGTYALVFQMKSGIFKKKENRLAVVSAIDVNQFQQKLHRNNVAASGMWTAVGKLESKSLSS